MKGVIKMSQIFDLFSLNYVDSLLAIITIIIGSVALKEALERFCKTFGIELAWIRKRREQEEREKRIDEKLNILEKKQRELEEMESAESVLREEYDQKIITAIDTLQDNLTALGKDIETREAERQFKKLRYDILNFANQITLKTEVSTELISQVYREIHEYESLVEDYGFKNNQVDASVGVITKKYQEMLIQGKILTEDSVV